MVTDDKPLTENCAICKNKIHSDRGFGWADIGIKEKATASVHIECLGMGSIMEDIQDNLNKTIRLQSDKKDNRYEKLK
jgi:hypothetical protein